MRVRARKAIVEAACAMLKGSPSVTVVSSPGQLVSHANAMKYCKSMNIPKSSDATAP